jgi:major membrane immunogen (membrane-anchored lipoprotein)
MKRFAFVLVGVMAVSLALVGCGKKGVNTSNLQSSFKSADSATQGDVDKAVSAIKAGNYSEAMTDLQRLAGKAKLTPEQQQAIKDVMAQVQQQITEAANKAAGDLKKSLPLK